MSGQSADIVEFSKFYMENVPRLIAFLVCQDVSVIDAADCVQETLIETYDGATPAEIAAELGMYPATVRSTLRNARAALGKLRAADGEQE